MGVQSRMDTSRSRQERLTSWQAQDILYVVSAQKKLEDASSKDGAKYWCYKRDPKVSASHHVVPKLQTLRSVDGANDEPDHARAEIASWVHRVSGDIRERKAESEDGKATHAATEVLPRPLVPLVPDRIVMKRRAVESTSLVKAFPQDSPGPGDVL
eukprot:CAMPEP_0174709238 /NCGR_PEP_ID=MMETSP1094-20130205/11265_1 /TAXON_ID=156173 /ORGANISM="Chrysochromulina brevifilum, Strain UTEX LB 985" /LENGTH=155 /DNA_ID=CAMNT_0015907895 /DNA_START=279 /DNA_END=748 /DNA_ORIENTATION=-